MTISHIDKYRMEILKREWEVNSFRKNHSHYKTHWEKILGNEPTAGDIKKLGENLRSIMKALGGDRDNSGVSSAGHAFECMISWYLNLLFWGTPVIVAKKHSSLPKVFSDITAVTIDGKRSNSETDLIAFSIPESEKFFGSPTELNRHLEEEIKDVDLTIIQTKTNWNENSQIPMLWNLIYNVDKFRVPNIAIGINGFSPLSVNQMTYAFVTMPSQKDLNQFKSSSMTVKRVKSVSGGNFWCSSEKDDVVSAIHQFPTRNFARHIAQTPKGNLWGHVKHNLDNAPAFLNSFLNLNFNGMT